MRYPRPTRGLVVLATVAMLIVACGQAASPSPSPRPSPSPSPTPDPHLSDPADLQVVYSELQRAGLPITVNTASESGAGKEPLRRLQASLGGWPLELSEYSSTAARETGLALPPDGVPVAGDPPYTFAGLNIAATFGPKDRKAPPSPPDARYTALARQLGEVLDIYLGPLAQRSVTLLGLPTPDASAGSSGEPSGGPSASPKPS